jgi:hypothetical protein
MRDAGGHFGNNRSLTLAALTKQGQSHECAGGINPGSFQPLRGRAAPEICQSKSDGCNWADYRLIFGWRNRRHFLTLHRGGPC